MKAVAYSAPGPIDREDALQDITLETPKAECRDLLVKINAVSVNPLPFPLGNITSLCEPFLLIVIIHIYQYVICAKRVFIRTLKQTSKESTYLSYCI